MPGIIKRRPLAPRTGCRDCPHSTEERNRGSDGATKWRFEPVSGRPWDTASGLFTCPQLRMCSQPERWQKGGIRQAVYLRPGDPDSLDGHPHQPSAPRDGSNGPLLTPDLIPASCSEDPPWEVRGGEDPPEAEARTCPAESRVGPVQSPTSGVSHACPCSNLQLVFLGGSQLLERKTRTWTPSLS